MFCIGCCSVVHALGSKTRLRIYFTCLCCLIAVYYLHTILQQAVALAAFYYGGNWNCQTVSSVRVRYKSRVLGVAKMEGGAYYSS